MDTKYLDNSDTENLALIRVTVPQKSRDFNTLTHRDYLGSILGLGIERRVVGDIIVTADGADITVDRTMADFILLSLTQVGKTHVETELLPIGELRTGEIRTKVIRDTVASLRLDNIVSSGFRLSRAKAQEAVRRGLVAVNGKECVKSDFILSEGDKVSLRHSGKVMLSEVGGESRKGRIAVVIEKFL